ncbi:unnamed protein product [Trypanosoma congolense IL3000]|uniref:WGS project CAEQ00000000 data, annotated contig 1718 n=1 Tax=Trypanosoma congolense (strain IL3000) TaxID=1068625 RepID=F9W889_TRYCI|nr:unnamed protein product [Trypanosoma congolense IL3000]
MMMNYWMVVMVFIGVSAQESGADGKDHNGEEHTKLCAVLKEAVGMWGEGRQSLSESLKMALHRTIFGNESGGDLAKLKEKVPADYDILASPDAERGFLCGEPVDEHLHKQRGRPWSGHSAPHDLVCLCTLGKDGWPLNESNNGIDKLCGRLKDSLGGENEGWSGVHTEWIESSETLVHHAKGETQIKATWFNVTKPCLEGNRKGENLKEALKTFVDSLKPMPSTGKRNGAQLGEGNPNEDHACTGSRKYGVCVMYYPNDKDTKTWWVDLQKALIEDEKIQKERDEEAKRKQEEAAKKDTNKTEDLKSTNPTTNQTEQNKTATLHETMRKFNLTSGTHISMPSSWLLRAVFLF